MSVSLRVVRAGPLTTIQDGGRFGALRHGVSASGPMDEAAFVWAGVASGGGRGGIEFTRAGLELEVLAGNCRAAFAGAQFACCVNGVALAWPGTAALTAGDRLAITPGAAGNYGYLRFDRDLEVAPVMGSLATNSRAGIGGLAGRALVVGDVIALGEANDGLETAAEIPREDSGPIRVIWGLHAERFAAAVRERFAAEAFTVSSRLDRMGVQLDDRAGVFAGASALGLVSDAIVPGDIQILGDGTPIVLMRDHQPTGGYPRIATVISADLARFAQLRPGTAVAFAPVTVEHGQRVLRSGRL
jgi:biotin-dependent carboxylase-like uncharacterized protein